jgi:hypothetical protein
MSDSLNSPRVSNLSGNNSLQEIFVLTCSGDPYGNEKRVMTAGPLSALGTVKEVQIFAGEGSGIIVNANGLPFNAVTSTGRFDISIHAPTLKSNLQIGSADIVDATNEAINNKIAKRGHLGAIAFNSGVATGIDSFAIGTNTQAIGDISFAGGAYSAASQACSYAYGWRAKAVHLGASVESDTQDADVSSLNDNEKRFRFSGGYHFMSGSAFFEFDVSSRVSSAHHFVASARSGQNATVTIGNITDNNAVINSELLTADRLQKVPNKDGIFAFRPDGPYSNDAAAAAAGVEIGDIYYHGDGKVHVRQT